MRGRSLLRRVTGPAGDLFRRATAPLRRVPDVVVIGAMKGGTTTLFALLAKHPDIRPSSVKEVHYFDTHYHLGERWYRSHFPLSRRGLALEATPRYLFDRATLGRMRALVPEARLLVVLREPVGRAYSHYQHMRRTGRETRPFAEAMDADIARYHAHGALGGPEPEESYFSYARRSLYADQLGRYLDAYPGRVLALPSERLFADPQAVADDAFRFVGLAPVPVAAKPQNVGGYDGLPPDAAAYADFFAPHNARLFELLGQTPWW